MALGAMAERITRFIDGGDRFVLGQISVAGEGMGMGTGFTAGGLLSAAKIAEIAAVPGVSGVQAQVMMPLVTSTAMRDSCLVALITISRAMRRDCRLRFACRRPFTSPARSAAAAAM